MKDRERWILVMNDAIAGLFLLRDRYPRRSDRKRSMTPAVSSGRRVVDGYVRVGPNRWSRRDDVSGV